MKYAVPRRSIKRVLSRRARGTDDRRRGNPTRTERGSASGKWSRRVFEVFLPQEGSPLDVDRVDVVRYPSNDRNFFRTIARRNAADNQRRQKRVHFARLVIGLD